MSLPNFRIDAQTGLRYDSGVGNDIGVPKAEHAMAKKIRAVVRKGAKTPKQLVTSHEAIVCFMDVRGFSNFARQQLGDVQVGKFIQGIFGLFDRYVCARLPSPVHVKGVGDGLLTIWSPRPRSKDRIFFFENLSVLLAQTFALHRTVADGRLAAETGLMVSEEAPKNLGFGIFAGPISQLPLVLPAGQNSIEFIGTAINIAARLQDFCRPSGISVGCVPDFAPALRSAVHAVGADLFTLKELDATVLSGVLGDTTLRVYVYRPAVPTARTVSDLQERASIDLVSVDRLRASLASNVDAAQREAISIISANRITALAEDLKNLSTNTSVPTTARDPALAAYFILVGPAALPLIQRMLQDVRKTKEWDLVDTCLEARDARSPFAGFLPTLRH